VAILSKETLLAQNSYPSVEEACRKLPLSFSHALIELNDDKVPEDPTVTLETPLIQLGQARYSVGPGGPCYSVIGVACSRFRKRVIQESVFDRNMQLMELYKS